MSMHFARLLRFGTFDTLHSALQVELKPKRFKISSSTGYVDADLDIFGAPAAQHTLCNYLASGVEIYDQGGRVVWSGLLMSSASKHGSRVIGRTLVNAANAVSVGYTPPNGGAALTAFAVNAGHAARYGTKELVYVVSDAGEDYATVLRDTLLAQRSMIRGLGTTKGDEGAYAVGWFETLDWRYFDCPDEGLEFYTPDEREQVFQREFVVRDAGGNDAENATLQFGDTTNSEDVYITWTAEQTTANLDSIEIKICRSPGRSDTLIAELYADVTSPTGSSAWILSSKTIAITEINTAHDWLTLSNWERIVPAPGGIGTETQKVEFLAGVKYSLRLRGSSGVVAGQWFRLVGHNATTDPYSETRLKNPSAYVLVSFDPFYRIECKTEGVFAYAPGSASATYAQRLNFGATQAPYSIMDVTLQVSRVGNPTLPILVRLHDGNETTPHIAEATIPMSEVTHSPKDFVARFYANVPRPAGTQFTISIANSFASTPIRVHYYRVGATRIQPATGFSAMRHRIDTPSPWTDIAGQYMLIRASYGEESTARIARIVAQCGQFIASTVINTASNVIVPTLARRDIPSGQLVRKLLELGRKGGRALRAWITPQREMIVSEEPALGPDALYEQADGTILTAQAALNAEIDMTVGRWVRPLSLPIGEPTDEWAYYVEAAEWSDNKTEYSPRSAWDDEDITIKQR